MKKLILFAAAALAMTACSGDDPYLDVSPELATKISAIQAVGDKYQFSIETDEDWYITTDNQTWYSFDKMSGTGSATVTITVEQHLDTKPRTADFSISTASLQRSFTITQAGPAVPTDPSETVLKVRMLGGDKQVAVPEGYNYNVVIPDQAQSWITVAEKAEGSLTLNFARNTTDEVREAEIELTTSENEPLASVAVSQSWRNAEPGEFLIEEIFCTGNIIPSTGKVDTYAGDQYFKITNNTDEVLYADGLFIMETKINSVSTFEYIVDIRDEYTGIQCAYCIPGDGDDVPVQPHASLLIANNAQNNLEANPNGMDLSGADFEWYDESTNSSKDVDNPEVPNLEKWYTYSLSFWYLHNRGYSSYALAFFPPSLTCEDFIENYKWEGQYISHTLVGDFTMNISSAYKIPNSWVIDAVAQSVKDGVYWLPFSTSLDAGYTYVCLVDSDPDRYGKAVVRKKNDDGTLVDTNNSTMDFEPCATPSVPIGQ